MNSKGLCCLLWCIYAWVGTSFRHHHFSTQRYPLSNLPINRRSLSHSAASRCVRCEVRPLSLSSIGNERDTQNTTTVLHRARFELLSIPVQSAFVGLSSSWLAVKLFFYPLNWRGISLLRWPNQPFGILGWQGIVPAKRRLFAQKMVDVSLAKVLSMEEMLRRLDPARLSSIFSKSISELYFRSLVPSALIDFMARPAAHKLFARIHELVDVRQMLVDKLSIDPLVMVLMLQEVARKQFNALVVHCTLFGFVFGWLYLFLPIASTSWMHPLAGFFLGMLSNWIAVKLLFAPLNPIKLGPLLVHGQFLKRQSEVARSLARHLSENILPARELWGEMFREPTLSRIVDAGCRIITSSSSMESSLRIQAHRVADALKFELFNQPGNAFHPVHVYTEQALNLKEALSARLSQLPPHEFAKVLHSVFAEDEFGIVLAGGVFGFAVASLRSWWMKKKQDDSEKDRDKIEVK